MISRQFFTTRICHNQHLRRKGDIVLLHKGTRRCDIELPSCSWLIDRYVLDASTIFLVIVGLFVTQYALCPIRAYGAGKLVALSDQIVTIQGKEIPLTLKVNGTAPLSNRLTFSFSLPRNGTILGTAPDLLYTP